MEVNDYISREFCSGSCFDTREKGLQCVGYLEDVNDAETQSINTCPISEINIEGRSCVNSVGTDSRKSFSDTALGNETCTGGTSIENCKHFVEESVEVQTEAWPIPCRCHRLEPETCKSEIGTKKKRKKAKSKSKEETKGTKSCLKAMQEIVRPRQKRQTRKGCTFDMKHFQDKILTLLDQECGICQCCNCNSPGKLNVESRPERHVDRQTKCEKRVEKEEKQSGLTKRERIPTTIQRDDKTVMVYRTSMASNNKSSTMSGRQRESAEKEKNIESSSRRSGSRRAKRARRVQVSASSSELEICNINRKEKRKKRRSKESKKKFSCDS
ncbi:uncharacterized protein LOC124183262 [Neodiprion fabricii]|uniref:uncharacterized protein LOC124183262 n=1 Tax=Neodiprion fabricii TaxID=2872261 RepID=UPI001ED90297|nr:uncharacterized protein LOC124183262 [Neodiprion fabricii]